MFTWCFSLHLFCQIHPWKLKSWRWGTVNSSRDRPAFWCFFRGAKFRDTRCAQHILFVFQYFTLIKIEVIQEQYSSAVFWVDLTWNYETARSPTMHPNLSIHLLYYYMWYMYTLLGTNISRKNGILKMIFLFPRWDMLIPWSAFQFLKYITSFSTLNCHCAKSLSAFFHCFFSSGNRRSHFFRSQKPSGWWFQPLWKILVKMGIFPK